MDVVFWTDKGSSREVFASSELTHEDKLTAEKREENDRKEAFVFPEVTQEEEAKLAAAEKKVEDTCQSFAEALDSVSKWLTKELLDIYEKLEGILWEKKDETPWKDWVERSVLRGMAYKLLYEKHKDIFQEKLKDMLWEMLRNLSEYEKVKIKHKSLKEMLRSCASIASVQSAINIDWWRTFIPGNLGCHNPY